MSRPSLKAWLISQTDSTWFAFLASPNKAPKWMDERDGSGTGQKVREVKLKRAPEWEGGVLAREGRTHTGRTGEAGGMVKHVSLPGKGLVEPEAMRGTHQQLPQRQGSAGDAWWRCVIAWLVASLYTSRGEGGGGGGPPLPGQTHLQLPLSWTLASVLLCLATLWIHGLR